MINYTSTGIAEDINSNNCEIKALKAAQYQKLSSFPKKVVSKSFVVNGDINYVAKKTVTIVTSDGSNPEVSFGINVDGQDVGSVSKYPTCRRSGSSLPGTAKWILSFSFAPSSNNAYVTIQVVMNKDGVLSVS